MWADGKCVVYRVASGTQLQKNEYKYTNTNTQIQIHKCKYTNTSGNGVVYRMACYCYWLIVPKLICHQRRNLIVGGLDHLLKWCWPIDHGCDRKRVINCTAINDENRILPDMSCLSLFWIFRTFMRLCGQIYISPLTMGWPLCQGPLGRCEICVNTTPPRSHPAVTKVAELWFWISCFCTESGREHGKFS